MSVVDQEPGPTRSSHAIFILLGIIVVLLTVAPIFKAVHEARYVSLCVLVFIDVLTSALILHEIIRSPE